MTQRQQELDEINGIKRLSAEVEKLFKEVWNADAMKCWINVKVIEYERSVQFFRAEIKSLNEELGLLIDSKTYEPFKAESLDWKRSLKRWLEKGKFSRMRDSNWQKNRKKLALVVTIKLIRLNHSRKSRTCHVWQLKLIWSRSSRDYYDHRKE
jgi:hypothetical protein